MAEDEVGKAAFGADPAEVAFVGRINLLRRKNRLLNNVYTSDFKSNVRTKNSINRLLRSIYANIFKLFIAMQCLILAATLGNGYII